MFTVKLLWISLLQLILCGIGRPSPSFLTVPKSAIVSIRKNVSLECGVYSTTPASWDFIHVSVSSENSVFFNGRIAGRWKSRYRINNESTGHFDLVIDSVDHEHAGRYTCKDSSSNSKATAELTVIGSDPVCRMNVTTTSTDHIVSLWCEINSTGNLIPSMKWTKDNDAIENSTTQSTTINGLTTTTSFVRLQLQFQDNNTIERITVKCTTSFIWKNGSTVPHYEHVWDQTLNLPFTADSSSSQLEAWIMAAVGSSIVIIILIILCIVFLCRKKKAKRNTSAATSSLNTGTSGKAENTERETEGKRLPKTQRRDFEERGTESVEAYETFANRPTAAMQSVVYCELNLTEQEKPKTKSATLNDKKLRAQTQTIETYEMLANRPAAAMQSETYCELNLSKQDKPKSKPLTPLALEDQKQEYQTMDEYESFTNRPSPAGQSETYCELQIVKKKKDKKNKTSNYQNVAE